MPHATSVVAWGVVSASRSPVALGARDDGFNSPHKRVTVPEVVGARLHAAAPWLTRCRPSEVGRLHPVVTVVSELQDDRDVRRRLRPSVLHEAADTTTMQPLSIDDLVTRTRRHTAAVAHEMAVLDNLHDGVTSSAVDAGKDALQEWTNSGMDVRWRTVKDPFSSGQLPMGFGHSSHTSSLTFVRSGFYRILLYHFL
ncbi:hypothetical protein B7Z00_01925 [Candidatus Saccharibacteria bacterium 32-50-10]|nr:MAG: hypothetical protein B7Z00_01925 [Candidatus Saccharibacteria bacterium 32-50-10]